MKVLTTPLGRSLFVDALQTSDRKLQAPVLIRDMECFTQLQDVVLTASRKAAADKNFAVLLTLLRTLSAFYTEQRGCTTFLYDTFRRPGLGYESEDFWEYLFVEVSVNRP